MKSLQDLVKEKGGQEIDPRYKDAKMALLQQIADMAGNSMGGDLKGLQKVTVAAPDSQGVKMGLDKAKEMLGKGDMEEGSPEEEASETPDEEAAEEGESPEEESKEGAADADILKEEINHETGEGDMSDQEIDDLIQLLQSKKKGAAPVQM